MEPVNTLLFVAFSHSIMFWKGSNVETISVFLRQSYLSEEL